MIRPLVLLADRTARQRGWETHTHPETVRQLTRRFRQQGVLGLLPGDVEVVHRERVSPIPDAVRRELDWLKALYPDFHSRELARIVFCKVRYRINDKTVKKLWHRSAVPYNVGDQFRRHVMAPRFKGGAVLGVDMPLRIVRRV